MTVFQKIKKSEKFFLLSVVVMFIIMTLLELRGFVFQTVIASFFITVCLFWAYFFPPVTSHWRRMWKIISIVCGVSWLSHFLFHVFSLYTFGQTSPGQTLCRLPLFCIIIFKVFTLFRLYRFFTFSVTYFVKMCFLFFGLFVISNNKKVVYSNIFFLFCLSFMYLFLSQINYVTERIYDLSARTWQAQHVAFFDRFTPFDGGVENEGWIWPYTRFLDAHVPENAELFIPPQSDTWPLEGNPFYLRWFIFPRRTTGSSDPRAPIPAHVKYIIVSRGGWNGGESGWPKIFIPPESILQVNLINRTTLRERTLTGEAYYKEVQPTEWGVMELK